MKAIAKTIVSLFFFVSIVIFNVYMYGIFNQTTAELNDHKNSLDQLTKENGFFKDQINSLKNDVQEQTGIIASQKELVQETQQHIDQLSPQMEELKVLQQKEIGRLDGEQAIVKKHLGDVDGEIEELKKLNKQWQRDYIVVLANLDKMTKELEGKLKETRADFLGRMGSMDARLDKFNKQLNDPVTVVKPSILHKRLSNDALGLQDITEPKSSKIKF